MADALPRRLAAEAVGSFFLFAAVIGSGIMAEALAGGNVAVALLANTIATGAILFVLITMLGPLSGAHFNPAVSLVMAARKNLPWTDAGAYMIMQLAGGLLGALTAHLMFDLPLWQYSVKPRTGIGQWTGEAVATFGLILTIIGTLRHRPSWVPASVALYITAAYWFTSSTSFANPAITVVRSLTDSFAGIAPADVPMFILAQLLGAAAGALLGSALFDRSAAAGGDETADPLRPFVARRRRHMPRELIDTGTDKRYVRRDEEGQFSESDDVGRSHAQDQKRDAENEAKRGEGDKGDR